MAGKVTDNRSYNERVKPEKDFYFFLLKLFLSAALVLGAGLGYLWYWLARYEARSPQGAISTYLERVYNHEWDGLYEDDITYFTELNSKDVVVEYLLALYEGKNHWGMTSSYSWGSEDHPFYDIYYERERICVVELYKPPGSDSFKVRTMNPYGQFSFDDLSDTGFSINNVSIVDNEEFPPDTGKVPHAFADLDLDEKMPDVDRYTIASFINAPTVSVNDPDKNIAVRDYSASYFYIGPRPTAEQKEEFEEEIISTAVDYCKYITKDGTFYALNQHLYPYTDFYNNIRGFDNQWFSNHDSIEFRNMVVFDVMPIGDNAFIGSISFDYIVTNSKTTKTYSSTYQLFFVRNSRDLWKLTNLVIVYDDSGDN